MGIRLTELEKKGMSKAIKIECDKHYYNWRRTCGNCPRKKAKGLPAKLCYSTNNTNTTLAENYKAIYGFPEDTKKKEVVLP